MLRNFMHIVALMAFTLLVATPLSEAYDFIGSPSHGLRAGADEESPVEETIEEIPVEEVPLPDEDSSNLIEDQEIVEEVEPEPVEDSEPVEEIIEPVIVKEEPIKEKPAEPKVKAVSPVKQTIQTVLPEPTNIPAQEKKLTYFEIDYDTLLGGNVMDKLPPSESGSYVIIYRSDNCPYCDKLIRELKDNVGDYVLVSIRCKGMVRDLFYSRWISAYPAFIVIKNKRVTYYGYGYRTLEEFKKLL